MTSSIIDYDEQGNPTTITNFYFKDKYYAQATLNWDGRQLMQISIEGAYSDSINYLKEDDFSNVNYDYYISTSIAVKGGQEYTFSMPGQFVDTEILIYGNYGEYINESISNPNYCAFAQDFVTCTFTTGQSESELYFELYAYDLDSYLYYFGIEGFQLEEGAVRTSYVEYVSPLHEIVYTYNDQGYRTSKTIDDITISYSLSGSSVLMETDGTYVIIFHYDYDGTIIGFTYDPNVAIEEDENEYFYLRNIQGDITHIIDENGNTIVQYTYDAYGNVINLYFEQGFENIVNVNPYTYRGYRYDSEINMYYLNSRYYNPVIGRFISSDGLLGAIGDILSTNMYAYCANNPVMYSDITGLAPEWLMWVGVSVLAVAIVCVAVMTAGAVIAAAPALAGFAQTLAVVYTGSLALGSAAATAVSVGAAVIAVSTIAIGVNEGINVLTGNNYLRNVMGEKGYNTFSVTVGMLAYSYILAGSILPYPSTGNNQPTNLKSSITLNAAKTTPNSGTRLFGLNDPRMPGWLGWSKYQMSFGGNTIHYVGNRYLQGWYPF